MSTRANRVTPWPVALVMGAALLASPAFPASDKPAAGGRWLFHLASGASTMQLADVKSFYSDVLDGYRAAGIPLDPQREFPANILLGGDVLYEVKPEWFLGLGSRYAWTHGYTLYEDPGGTLDVITRVGLVSVTAVLQRSWESSGRWTPFVELRTGSGFVSFDHSESLNLSGTVSGSVEQTLTGNGHALLVEFDLGARRNFGRVAVVGAAGYRHCNVPGPPFDLDVSGVVLTLGVAHLSH